MGVLGVVFPLFLEAAAYAQTATLAQVCGSVMDPNGAVLPDAAVTFRGGGESGQYYTARVERQKQFQYCVNLPAGAYTVSVQTASRNLMEFRRAPVRLGVGDQRTLDLRPVFRGGIALTIQGDKRLPDPVIRYAHIPLNGPGLAWQVRYAKVRAESGRKVYSGPHLLLTHDFLTIFGSECLFNPERKEVVVSAAPGQQVEIENGRKRWRSEAVTIDVGHRRIKFPGGSADDLSYD